MKLETIINCWSLRLLRMLSACLNIRVQNKVGNNYSVWSWRQQRTGHFFVDELLFSVTIWNTVRHLKLEMRCDLEKKWNITHINHFCFLSLLFAVSLTATVGTGCDALQSFWLLVSVQVGHRTFAWPGFCQKPAPHLTQTNSQRYAGGILQSPAKCGQCSGLCWKIDDLAAWEPVFIVLFWAKKHVAGKIMKITLEFWTCKR